MKFDTNKTKAPSCTKISAAQCYLMDNASIPSSAPGWDWPTARDNNAEVNLMSDDDDAMNGGGRQVMYEPTVVFTPVYASMRQQSGSPGSTTEKRALLSWPNVKDVLSQLEALSLGFGNSNSNNEGSNNDMEARKMPAKEARDDAVTTGRYLLRGNRKREASTLAGFAAPAPVASAPYMPAAAAAAAPYQPTVRRSPRLHPEIATSMPAAEPCPYSGNATKRRAAGPFGY
jgi:hypothetical protein